MQNSKLIRYLTLLSNKDLNQFQAFVDSPYFNKHKNTKSLLRYILKSKTWQRAHLEKEKAFEYLFPDRPYEEQLLSNVLSYLLRLLRRFLVQKQFEQKEVEQQLVLLEMAFHAQQEKLFELTAGRLAKSFQESTVQDSEYYFQQNRYQRLLDDFDLNFGNRSSGEHLEKAWQHFDVFFIGEKLKMTCQMLARKQVTAQSYSPSLIKELLHFLEDRQEQFQQIPSVWIYYLVYQMMTKNDPVFYFELKNRLRKESTFFKHQEGRDLYTHTLNYCIQRINFGEANFRKETFELYQQMLANGLLLVDGVLSPWDYTNIVSLGCLLQEYTWTKHFINEQKVHLPKGEKENTFTYNLAAFHYSQQAYEKAIVLLQKVAFTEVYYNLLTRILLLKIYFDKEDWLALEYALETFRIYLLRNKKITDSRRKSGLNFLRFTKSLMLLVNERTLLSQKDFVKKVQLLKTQIEEKEMVLNKSWLLQKLSDGTTSTST